PGLLAIPRSQVDESTCGELRASRLRDRFVGGCLRTGRDAEGHYRQTQYSTVMAPRYPSSDAAEEDYDG
ncbi:MAG TPA: hypothetical protein VLA73_06740, partial [Burkholderiales bacterium]|nr:hypothetical protein [Burkholderiales bacterium]